MNAVTFTIKKVITMFCGVAGYAPTLFAVGSVWARLFHTSRIPLIYLREVEKRNTPKSLCRSANVHLKLHTFEHPPLPCLR